MDTSHLDDDEPPSIDGGVTGVHVENLQDLPVDMAGWSHLVRAVLAAEGYPATTQVTVVFVDDDHMTELNQGHLGGAGPTDVISVPLERLTPGHVPVVDAGAPPLMLGDIFISPETVARKAADDDIENEMALMVVHATYHLLGWDHADDASALAMEGREREVLESMGRRRR